MSDVLNVVVCKQGDAYRCSICGRGVSASAPGQEQIRRGACQCATLVASIYWRGPRRIRGWAG